MHAGVEGIVHIAPPCFTPAKSLPVRLCPPRKEVRGDGTPESVIQRAREFAESNGLGRVQVVLPPELAHLRDAVEASNAFPEDSRHELPSISVCEHSQFDLMPAQQREAENEADFGGVLLDWSADGFVWVGDAGSRLLSRLAMEAPEKPLARMGLDGEFAEDAKGEAGTKRELVRRASKVERFRSADIVAMLVGAPGSEGTDEGAERIRRLARKAGKTCYSVVTGRPTPEKLGNFSEVEAFAHLACWNSAMMDSSEYIAPIVTAFEAEIALLDKEFWRTGYSFLPSRIKEEWEEDVADEDGGTGSRAIVGSDSAELSKRAERALEVRDERTWLAERRRERALTAAEHLLFRRSYVGMVEQGQDGEEPAPAEEGSHGRAAQYDFEKGQSD